MQDTEFEKFDLEMRSMLADAEVKPSRRVWKGVSARLDADAAPVANPWGWMKWAGVSLAAVAVAVACVVFFSSTRTSIPTKIFNQSQADMLAQTGETAGAPTDVAAPAAMPASEVGSTASQAVTRPAVRSARPQATDSRPVPAQEVSGEQPVPETVAQPAEEPQRATASEPGRQSTRPATTVTVEPAVDPFAALEPERKGFKPRLALYAQGSVGSNDASFPAAPAARMAPGGNAEFEEILGSGSTYGVPFSLGIGVRFYVTPRLSIGTGLDYSLLTRTFTGSYWGTAGTVSHTVQYIGIPVRLYYDILTSDRINFYAYGGGEAELCIGNNYRLFGTPDIVRNIGEGTNTILPSVNVGVGVEFRVGRRIGLYLDPGVNYYFPGNQQPRSIRTDKPLMLNFDAGLRFNF